MDYFFNFEKMPYLKGKRPAGCILCLVRDKDDSAVDLTVFRNGEFLVCLNLYPYNPGHLLVFPRRHVTDIRQLSKIERALMDETVNSVLDVLDKEYHPSGYNIGYNMGLDAGASIEHLHLHIIPRYPRELGITELLGGKRVLVENPLETRDRLINAFAAL